MSILIKNQAIFKIIICVGVALLTISCKEVDPHADTDEYTYMDLTPELIRELGGVDSLYRYQFYLSNSFELIRVDNEKSFGGQGVVKNVENNYNVVFDKLTPGIYHGTELIESESYFDPEPIRTINILFEHSLYAYLTFSCEEGPKYRDSRFYHVKGTLSDNLFTPEKSRYDRYKFCEVYRDSFMQENGSEQYALYGPSGLFYMYKNHFWNKKMIYTKNEKKQMMPEKWSHPSAEETYLIIRVKNISKTSTEHAQGIVLPESL